jgi:hypothetical protein
MWLKKNVGGEWNMLLSPCSSRLQDLGYLIQTHSKKLHEILPLDEPEQFDLDSGPNCSTFASKCEAKRISVWWKSAHWVVEKAHFLPRIHLQTIAVATPAPMKR